jgi:hypothetical protein
MLLRRLHNTLLRHLAIVGSAITLGAAVTACSDIDEAERIIPAPDFTPQRSVLVEDFTGQKCVNCPNAHELIDSLKSQSFGSAIIPVSIHGGSFALNTAAATTLGTDAGEAYVTSLGVEAFPSCRVNMRSDIIGNLGQWTGAILNELLRAPQINFAGEAATATVGADGSLSINVKLNLLSTSTTDEADLANAHLGIWLVEDSITAMQFLPSGAATGTYEHNNVLRTALTADLSGDAIAIDSSDDSTAFSHTFTVGSDVKMVSTAHLRIVAFVSTPTDGVLNATQFPVEITE